MVTIRINILFKMNEKIQIGKFCINFFKNSFNNINVSFYILCLTLSIGYHLRKTKNPHP